MSVTEATLANQALRLLGEYSLAALDEGTEIAETVQLIQQDTIRFLLAVHPWRFTMRKARLARLATGPINEWTHAHALPADRLTVRAMYAAEGAGALPVRHYEIFDNRVFSNQADMWCDYQVSVDPGGWPPHFYNLARNALAADFAMAVGAGASAAEQFQRRAYGTPGENMAGGLMGLAKRLDSQQQPPQEIADHPLVAARHGGFAGRY